jgi:hypothetical protein
MTRPDLKACAESLRAGELPPDPMALADFLERQAANAARRAENGPRNARIYAERVERGIRQAIGQLPAESHRLTSSLLIDEVLSWITVNEPEEFGLERLPDPEGVGRVLKKMHAERRAMLLPVVCPDQAADASAIASTTDSTP